MLNEFSSLKAAWHIDKIADLRRGKDIVPTHVQLIISDLCNQDCGFCAYRMPEGFSVEQFAGEKGEKNPTRFIPTAKAKEILDDCAEMGVGAIEFTGGGEPTVHPDWIEIVSHAQFLGMATGLVTNGIKLREHPGLNRLKWLRISLDAGQQTTYETIRRSRQWGRAMEALKLGGRLVGPYVGAGFVVTADNYLEIYQATKLVRDAGIPYIRLSAMFSHLGSKYYSDLLPAIDEQRRCAKELETSTFKVVDFFNARVQDLEFAAPDYKFCGEQQFVLYIGGDQKVYTCCTNAYTKKGELGSLKEQSFMDFLATTRRFDFDARSCHHCQFNEKNRVINYMLGTPPHVDFV